MDDLNYFGENIEWTEINRVIRHHDWVMEFKDLPPCEKLDRFLNICHELSETYVTKKRFAQEKKHGIPPRARRILMRERGQIQTRLKATNKIKTRKLKYQLIRIERELKNSYRKKSENDEKKTIKAIKKNVKYFFSC